MSMPKRSTAMGSGRTYRQLEALPNGSIYIVESRADVHECEAMLVKQGRRSNVLRIVPCRPSAFEVLIGLDRATQIAIDHRVWEIIDPETLAALHPLLQRYQQVERFEQAENA